MKETHLKDEDPAAGRCVRMVFPTCFCIFLSDYKNLRLEAKIEDK